MKVSLVLCFACVALGSGCTSRSLAGPEPGPTPRGAYFVSARITDDSCSPAVTPISDTITTFNGDADRMGFFVPDVQFSGNSAFQTFAFAVLRDGVADLRLDHCGAGHVAHLALVDRDERSFTVRQTDSWTGLDAADHSCAGDTLRIPTQDCHVTVELHYELDVACEAACQIALKASGNQIAAVCSCNPG